MKTGKKMTKAILALLLAGLMLFSLAACGKKDEPGASEPVGDSAPAVRDTINVAISQDSGSLHPLVVTGAFTSVIYNYYEPLFDFKSDGTIIWKVAESMDIVSDIQRTLHIRQGVTFSNGNPLTAEDVMFTMELCLEDPGAWLNVKAVDFERTRVVDEYTIDLWYTEFNAGQEPGFCMMMIMDKESYDEVALSLNPIGTGPYVVTDYVVNSHLTLEARDDYWGGTPAIKKINFKVLNEQSQIINALETGEVDIAIIPVKDAAFVESLGYNIDTVSNGVSYVSLFSMGEGSPLASKEARYAVCHAIDRQAIVDVVFSGLSKAVDWPISESCGDYEARFANLHDTYSVGYDPDRARALAEQSGLVGQRVRIINNGTPDTSTIAEIIQNNLIEIGINAEILNYDQATYFDIIMDESNFEIAIFNPSAPSVLASDIFAMYLTFIPLGWYGPERDAYGQISMEALTTFDENTRSQKLYETLQMFLDFAPWYGLCEVDGIRARASSLRGVEYTVTGIIYFQNVYFAE